MTYNYFKGKEHVALYAKFRPLPPQELIDVIIGYLNKKDFGSPKLALDVGCGSGQSTPLFAPYFKNVLGIDVSKDQLEEAVKKTREKNVSYKLSPAEKLPVSDKSVQLVTASTACHLFDLPLFFEEAKRVLSPNGVLALFSYGIPTLHWGEKSEELSDALYRIFFEDIKEFWLPESDIMLNKYTDKIFDDIPFGDIYRRNDFHVDQTATVTEIEGFVKSFSIFQRYKESKGSIYAQAIIDRFVATLLKTMDKTNPDEARLTINFTFFILMGRKSSN